MALVWPLSWMGGVDDLLSNSAESNIRIDAAGEKVAIKIFAEKALPITDVDLYMDINGTVTGITFTLAVHADDSDKPAASPMNGGAAVSAGFSGLAADGWTGLKTLGSDTGNLTVNSPYWIVLDFTSGTPDATNYVQLRSIGSALISNRERLRHHNGTNWTTTAIAQRNGIAVVKYSDGSFAGYPITSGGGATNPATDIFSTNRQGLRFRVDAQLSLAAIVSPNFIKTGSPSGLELVIYEGPRQLWVESFVAADILSGIHTMFRLTRPVILSPGIDCYAVFRQASNGGSDSNDYDLRVSVLNTAYQDLVVPSSWKFVYGTGDNPTTYTIDATGTFPNLFPCVTGPTGISERAINPRTRPLRRP